MKKTKTQKFAGAVVARAAEPSTWAGLAVIAQAVKALCPQYALVIDVVSAVAGSVAVMQREGAKPVAVDGNAP